MSWASGLRRVGLALCGALALTACGFEPMYGDGAAKTQMAGLSTVRIDAIPDRPGQILRNYLIDRTQLRGGVAQRYGLAVSVNETRSDLGILTDASSTYAKLILRGNYRLYDLQTGATVTAGNVQNTTGYNVVSSGFGNISAAEDARNRALQEVGDDILNRVVLALTKK